MNRKIVLACACALATQLAQAQSPEAETSPWAFSLGVKTWAHEWSTWEITRVAKDTISLQTVDPIASGTTVAFTPLASLRYGRGFVSASYMTPTTYTLTGVFPDRHGRRSELDANFGYDVLRGVALSAGYKRLMQRVSGDDWTWSGPTIAATLSGPIEGGWGVYGTMGYGRFKVKQPAADAAGATSGNADYALLELGLAYSLRFAQQRSIAAAFGYRSQTVRTRNYAVSSEPVGGGGPVTIRYVDPRDYTQGWLLNLVGTF